MRSISTKALLEIPLEYWSGSFSHKRMVFSLSSLPRIFASSSSRSPWLVKSSWSAGIAANLPSNRLQVGSSPDRPRRARNPPAAHRTGGNRPRSRSTGRSGSRPGRNTHRPAYAARRLRRLVPALPVPAYLREQPVAATSPTRAIAIRLQCNKRCFLRNSVCSLQN